MGRWGRLFLSEEITQLEALRDLLKNEEDKKAIERAIEVCKKEAARAKQDEE